MASTCALTVGTILFGRYVIERIIGEGGFGITYYARHQQLGTHVAIKEFFISGTCLRNPISGAVTFPDIQPEVFEKYRKRFQEEAQTLCRLNNPHVVHVHDIFDQNGTTYIVMDYVAGETLQQKVQQNGPLSYEVAINYIAQLCEAVEHIHSHHILHRDIKPDNIIITPEYNVVLIDFGAARGFVHDKEQKHTAMLTMGYAPIEQYTATSKKGNYTDLYAVGGVFYYALTGQKPIPAADRILNDSLPEPRFFNPSIPEYTNRTIMKALNLKPEDRYQNVAEFRNDLLGGEKVDFIPSTPIAKNTPVQPKPDTSASSDKNGKASIWKNLIISFVVLIFGVLLFFLITNRSNNGSTMESTPSTNDASQKTTDIYHNQNTERWEEEAKEAAMAEKARIKALAEAQKAEAEEKVQKAEKAKVADTKEAQIPSSPDMDIRPIIEDIDKSAEEEDVIFVVVESMPEFPGGQQALFKFLSENVKYPVIAQENGIQGRVICQFVVNKDGSIVDVEVVRSGGDASLDKEAVRVIKSMPNWNPGKQRGKPVRVKYTVPVNFKLQ